MYINARWMSVSIHFVYFTTHKLVLTFDQLGSTLFYSLWYACIITINRTLNQVKYINIIIII